MPEFLLLRLEAPLQAWGDVALDSRRPTLRFPTRSALAGLIASALGWRYRDGESTTRLQDSLRFAVRQDRAPTLLRDYQTVDLGHATEGWTRWGVEKRGGAFSTGTHLLDKEYLADASFLAALTVNAGSPVDLDEIERALTYPARPLFLGRKSCPPALPLLEGRVLAASPYDALREAPLRERHDSPPLQCWYEYGDGPEELGEYREIRVSDRRDFLADRFAGERRVIMGSVVPVEGAEEKEAGR